MVFMNSLMFNVLSWNVSGSIPEVCQSFGLFSDLFPEKVLVFLLLLPDNNAGNETMELLFGN